MSGPHITKVYGGPGTGKTTRMIEIMRQEIASGVPMSRIAFLAYSNAAADEAWDRINKSKTSKRPQYFCTIHAACRRMLGWPHEKLWHWLHDKELAKSMGLDVNDMKEEAEFKDNPCRAIIEFARAKMIDLSEAMNYFPSSTVGLADVIEAQGFIDVIKKRFDVKDFSDLIEDYLDNPEPMNIDVMIVDEAQDLTAAQWAAVENMWANCGRVYICGDDDQTIYTHVGAEADGFLEYPCDEEEVLDISWRVPQSIGRYADRIIGNVEKRKQKNIKWRDEPGEIGFSTSSPKDPPIKEGESTLILCRHRMVAVTIFRELMEAEVHAGINGNSYFEDKRGEILATFFDLRDGKSVSRYKAVAMLDAMVGKEAAAKRLREMKGTKEYASLTRDMFSIDWSMPLWRLFGRTDQEEKTYYYVSRIISKKGEGVINQQPPVRVMTMHASKGKEADHVIVVPECFSAVALDQNGGESDREARLSYVAATRAKKRLTILEPSTKYSMKFFAGTPI